MNLNGCFTGLNIRESASRSTRERHVERPNQRNGPPSFGSRRRWPCSFWKRSTGCLYDAGVAQPRGSFARNICPDLAEETCAREVVLAAGAGGRWSTEAAVFLSSSVRAKCG